MPTLYSYNRVSTSAQTAGSGLGRQGDAAESFAAERGLPLTTFADPGRSAYRGGHTKRGPLARFLTAAQSGSLGHEPMLLVEDVDRLSRQEPLDALEEVVFALIRAGVEIVTLQDGATYSRETLREDAGRLVLLVLRVQAAHDYSRRLGARVAAAAARARDEGRPSWGAPAWLADERLAAAILQMFDLHETGSGSARIARMLNERGVSTPRGKTWSSASVRALMSRPALYGCLVRRNGERVPDFYPVLIPEERWLAAQGRRGRTKFIPTGRSSHFIGQGLCRCHHCGRAVGVHTSTSSGIARRRVRRLRCATPGCSSKSWPVDDANRFLLERLSGRALYELTLGPAAAPPDLTGARVALDAAEARVAALEQALEQAAAEPAAMVHLARALAGAVVAREEASAALAGLVAVPTAPGPAPGPPVGTDTADGRRSYSESLRRWGLRITCDFKAGTWALQLPGHEPVWCDFGPTWPLDDGEFGPNWEGPDDPRKLSDAN